MTIRHLLAMTEGFKWEEFLPYADPNNTAMQMEASNDWVDFVSNQPMLNEPGTVFNYNSGATVLLAYIFNSATGKDMEEYAATYFSEPLEKNYCRKHTPWGIADTEGGLYLDIKDVAKNFLFIPGRRTWENKQLVQTGWNILQGRHSLDLSYAVNRVLPV